MANDNFVERHNGPRQHEIAEMLNVIGVSSIDELIKMHLFVKIIRVKKMADSLR